MHIIVPLDGSSFAEEAITPAAALLGRTNTPNILTFARIISYGTVIGDASGFAMPVAESVFQGAIEGAQDYLAHVASRQPLHGISVETIAQMGNSAASSICHLADGGHPSAR